MIVLHDLRLEGSGMAFSRDTFSLAYFRPFSCLNSLGHYTLKEIDALTDTLFEIHSVDQVAA